MSRTLEGHNEILFTSPDLPPGDSFCLSNLSHSPRNPSLLSVSFSETEDEKEPQPRRPYVYMTKKSGRESPHKRNNAFFIQPRKDSVKSDPNKTVEVTKATDLSAGALSTTGKVKGQLVASEPKGSLNKSNPGGYLIRKRAGSSKKLGVLNKTCSILRSFRRISITTPRHKDESPPKSGILKEYWQKKAEIDSKYEKMLVQIDKETNLEISVKLTHAGKGGPASQLIDELSKIKEYYEGVKDLLAEQKIVEQEELLKEFQHRVSDS